MSTTFPLIKQSFFQILTFYSRVVSAVTCKNDKKNVRGGATVTLFIVCGAFFGL